MEDERIVELYWERSESAISETEKKYGAYCRSIAFNILSNTLDAEECVNDTYIKAWEAMPPHRPERLSVFLGKITRNISLNRSARNRAQKRSAQIEAVYEEISELVPDSAAEPSEELALREAVNNFLSSLSTETRIIFVQRYFYLCSIKKIAANRGLTESNVKVTLMRARRNFKDHLEKEGISI